MHVNKVHAVFTIDRVARDLGEDHDWLWIQPSEWTQRMTSSGVMA